MEAVCCVHCHKSFAYHGSNTLLTYHLQRTHLTQYAKVQPSKAAEPSTSGFKQGQLQQFFCKNKKAVCAQLQRDITTAICNWIATSGRLLSIVDDEGLQEVLRIALQNE